MHAFIQPCSLSSVGCAFAPRKPLPFSFSASRNRRTISLTYAGIVLSLGIRAPGPPSLRRNCKYTDLFKPLRHSVYVHTATHPMLDNVAFTAAAVVRSACGNSYLRRVSCEVHPKRVSPLAHLRVASTCLAIGPCTESRPRLHSLLFPCC